MDEHAYLLATELSQLLQYKTLGQTIILQTNKENTEKCLSFGNVMISYTPSLSRVSRTRAFTSLKFLTVAST